MGGDASILRDVLPRPAPVSSLDVGFGDKIPRPEPFRSGTQDG